MDAMKKLIPEKLDQDPVKIEEYKGLDIFYREDKKMYEVTIGKRTSRRKNIDQLKKLLIKRTASILIV
jgi:hypothetical protein